MSPPVRLRGHHLGCILGFAGHGYDPNFSSHLAEVAAACRDEPASPVLVVRGPDEVCLPCPHLRDGRCARSPGADERVRAHDDAFLQALGIAPGELVSLPALRGRLESDSRARSLLLDACTTCPWTGVCTFFQSLRDSCRAPAPTAEQAHRPPASELPSPPAGRRGDKSPLGRASGIESHGPGRWVPGKACR